MAGALQTLQRIRLPNFLQTTRLFIRQQPAGVREDKRTAGVTTEHHKQLSNSRPPPQPTRPYMNMLLRMHHTVRWQQTSESPLVKYSSKSCSAYCRKSTRCSVATSSSKANRTFGAYTAHRQRRNQRAADSLATGKVFGVTRNALTVL